MSRETSSRDVINPPRNQLSGTDRYTGVLLSSLRPLSRKSPYLENYGALICGKPLSQVRDLQSVFGPYLGNPQEFHKTV